MSVEALFETTLVEKVANETNGPAKNEKSVQTPIADHIICLFVRKSATAAKHIHEANGDAPINIQNEVCLLFCCDLFHGQGKLWRHEW